MKKNKLLTILVIALSLTITGSLGYATITYVMNTTVDENVIVGETAIYSDALIIELSTYDNYQLTFFEIEEDETSRHYITYTYNYTILVSGMNIEVSSLSNDIVVSELVATESTIAITFSLNQELEYEAGSIIQVQFYFEAVEKTLNEYTSSNPIDINNATVQELVDIGFTTVEAENTLAAGSSTPFADLTDLAYRIGAPTLVDRYSEYEVLGIIIFN